MLSKILKIPTKLQGRCSVADPDPWPPFFFPVVLYGTPNLQKLGFKGFCSHQLYEVSSIYFVPPALFLKCCWMCFIVVIVFFFYTSKAWCCLQLLAQKTVNAFINVDIKKGDFFSLYSVETMQKLIKDRTALSQSCVGCIQIWSHIIYSSLKVQDFFGTAAAALSVVTEDVAGGTKEKGTKILKTQSEGTQSQLFFVMISFFFNVHLYIIKCFSLCEKALLFMFVQCIVNVFCYKHPASCR